MKENQIVLPPDANGGVSITPPQGCEVDKVEVIDGVLTVTFKAAEKKLPKTWEEFCKMYPVKPPVVFIREGGIYKIPCEAERDTREDIATLPDRATAEAVLALCELIQLRDCYNGDWVPDWEEVQKAKHCIYFGKSDICASGMFGCPEILYFETAELRDEFLRNFRPIIEKLKPLYGIKKGGQE